MDGGRERWMDGSHYFHCMVWFPRSLCSGVAAAIAASNWRGIKGGERVRVRQSGWLRLGPDTCIHSSIARLHVCRISFVSVLYLLSFLCVSLSAFMGCVGFLWLLVGWLVHSFTHSSIRSFLAYV
mmetsp:Transcript_23462/g.67425  ORF Transcript_23462/g.67425 Transcript_23462/m.67425 type:complete len:125 (+) Transcript_23462:101-475(+)